MLRSARATSSWITPAARQPRPRPPNCSGSSGAMNPIAPISFMIARSRTRVRSRSWKPGAMRSLANRLAWSPSAIRSSSRYGFIKKPPWTYDRPSAAIARRFGLAAGDSDLLCEFPKIRLALFLKRLDALARFLGVVVKFQRVHSHSGNAGLMRGIHVEAALGDGDRGRAALAQFLAPLLHFGIELLMRHAGVGKPHCDRLLSGVAAAHVPD